jgi:hypothetical protein
MADEHMIAAHIAQSNMPDATKKSAIRKWYDGLTGGATSLVRDKVSGHVREGGHVIRQSGEAVIMGGLLGIVDAEVGLDFKGFPIDGIVAALGMGASIYMAHDPYGISADMRNIGSDALAILTYRKSKAWREKGKAGSHTTITGEDPIAAAARDL